jgi:adenylate cyclase
MQRLSGHSNPVTSRETGQFMTSIVRDISIRQQLRKVLGITVFWLSIATVMFLFEHAIKVTSDCTLEDANYFLVYLANMATVVLAGLIGGAATVFLFERWIRIWPYWKAVLSILAIFTLVFMFVSIIGFMLVSDMFDMPDEAGGSTLSWFFIFMFSLDFVRTYGIWFLIVMATLFGLIVYDKFGPGTLRKLLLGRYFNPKAEERVFMFLDLRSSTQIAEQLGEQKYFNLLRDVVQDATVPILNSRGEIYQYVGDEIVISWPLPNARHNANCLQCFYAIREALVRKVDYYQQHYGILPEYKAGLHYGKVYAGEIGVVKRDITYTGDVLNTTSRIQSKCNELGVDILLSKHLLDFLKSLPEQFKPREIGAVPLRGKSRDELLYTV